MSTRLSLAFGALLAVCTLGLTVARADAPLPCTLPEHSTSPQANGVYGYFWGRDSSLAPGSLLGCRDLGGNLWQGSANSVPAYMQYVQRAIQLRFVTSDAEGRRVPATGLVLVPTVAAVRNNNGGSAGANVAAPVIAIPTGTVGVADHCAPSRTLRTGGSGIADNVTYYLSKGMTVVVPDYVGLGTMLKSTPETMPPGQTYVGGDDHPYLEGESEGHAVLDALRAALQVRGGHYFDAASAIPDSWPVSLMGPSQGGHAALWATVLYDAYANDAFDLRATIAGNAPVDLEQAIAKLRSGVLRSLLAYALLGAANSTQQEVAGFDLAALLTPVGRDYIATARTSCAADFGLSTLVDVLFGAYKLEDLVDVTALMANSKFQAFMRENSLLFRGQARYPRPSTPVFAYHGAMDGAVPYEPARALHVSHWGATQSSSVAVTGDASLAREPYSFYSITLGGHLTTGGIVRNDDNAWLRYSPYEWLWDGIRGASRTDKSAYGIYYDLTP